MFKNNTFFHSCFVNHNIINVDTSIIFNTCMKNYQVIYFNYYLHIIYIQKIFFFFFNIIKHQNTCIRKYQTIKKINSPIQIIDLLELEIVYISLYI